ncbi:MAG TPA: thymidine phosphorylase, partial [Planctomycetia bacterium]|nr:thymidine phosphorylase [Planctomycetia bacterium]
MFNVARILERKRRGASLSAHEIRALIAGYLRGDVHDYQMAAFAMAVCCRGMDSDETATLTESMWRSGETLGWPEGPPVVDKHSTGGIGDKSSLVLAPLLAEFGVRVPMISGRGLGPTGGTLDKLESIPGFHVRLSNDDFRRVVASTGCAIVGQTMSLAPADRMLYALRDATGTVDSIPLIVASILAKKLAAGLDRLVLDVKFGSGAFGRSPDQARELAEALTSTAHRSGLATTALVTSMDQPTGRAVGNAVEVKEALATLAGDGPPDLAELVSLLGAELLAGVGRFS